MAKRKKKFTLKQALKKIFGFKISKKNRKNLFWMSFAALAIFSVFVLFAPSPEKPRKPSAPKPAAVKPSAAHVPPAAKLKAEPFVYYKKTVPPVKIPPRTFSSGPKLVFVLDDMGNTNQHTDDLLALGRLVNYAILPLLPYSAYFDRVSQQTGAEVILHLPLESVKGTIPGPGLITSAMPDDQVLYHLRRNLASVPHLSGVNNHMGSKGSADPRIMSLILSELKRRGLFFLDSKTTARSAGPQMASGLGVPLLTRDDFLDNEDSIPAIQQEILNLAAQARRQGYALGIGHYRPNTLHVLREEIPKLQAQGFEILSLSELLQYKSRRQR